jgi:predicted MFS family arabinose efflux permease
VLLEHFWWGSVFFITVPIIVIAMVAIALVVPNSRDEESHPLDPVGSLLSMVGLVALVFAIIEGPEVGWSSGVVIGGFVLAAVTLGGFVLWEHRALHPMLDPRYFTIPRFRMGSITITIAFFAMFGMFFSISQLLQFVRGYSPLSTGLALLPYAATIIVVAPRSTLVQQRLTVRRTIALGLTLIALGLALLATLRPGAPYGVIALAIVLMATGTGLATPSATASIMSSLPMRKAGVGSAVNDTTREVGGAVGIAVVGSVLASTYRSALGTGADVLPEHLRATARDNVGAAIAAGREGLGGDPAALERYLDDVGDAFTSGLNAGMGVCALLSLVGAVLVMRWYPKTTHLGEEVRMAAERTR